MTTTSSTTGTTSTTTTTSTDKTSTARTELSTNFDTFLQLLTAQLQYQDPLDPMDTSQFTQQLVQYSQVEQQLNTNDKLTELISLSKSQGVNAALGYLGMEVSSETSALPLQSSSASFSVDYEGTASTMSVSISDADGNYVRGFELSGFTSGDRFVWDGKDSNGNVLDDGAYKVTATVYDAAGKKIDSTLNTYGVVTGVGFDADGNTVLHQGKVDVAIADVIAANVPVTTKTTTTTDTSSSTDTSS